MTIRASENYGNFCVLHARVRYMDGTESEVVLMDDHRCDHTLKQGPSKISLKPSDNGLPADGEYGKFCSALADGLVESIISVRVFSEESGSIGFLFGPKIEVVMFDDFVMRPSLSYERFELRD